MTTERQIYLYLRLQKRKKPTKIVIPLYCLHLVLPREREIGKMQFESHFNPFQSTSVYLQFKFS